MKKLTLKTKKLNNLDSVLIGNGGQSRLDIMLDLDSGEVWADEYFDHEANSWIDYDDKNIIQIGTARNGILEDEETGVADENGYWWNVTIYPEDKNNIFLCNDIVLSNDYNNSYNVKDVLDAIKDLYHKLLRWHQDKKANVEKIFNKYAQKFGTIEWGGVELALTEAPFRDGPLDDPCFIAAAMDRDGDCWRVIWDILPDVDPNEADYADQCDWDSPAHAEIMWEGYYLDE